MSGVWRRGEPREKVDVCISGDGESLEEAAAGREGAIGKVWRLVGAEEEGSGAELWREARRRERKHLVAFITSSSEGQ